MIYGPSRIGKPPSIDYLRLLLSETHPRATCRRSVLREPARLFGAGHGIEPDEMDALDQQDQEACARNGSQTVILFCDEAQRYDQERVRVAA